MKPGRFTARVVPLFSSKSLGSALVAVASTPSHMAPSRQERRKAERAAAKRPPAQAGASGAAGAGGGAGAAAALANPLGAADPSVLGRGSHSFTFQLNLNALHGIGVARQGLCSPW